MTWNPAKQFAQDAERLPIEGPPCSRCKNWRPVRQHDSNGGFIGIRICHVDEMRMDFSCFVERETAAVT